MKVVIAEPVSNKLMELIQEHQPDWIVYETAPKDKAELIRRLQGAIASSSYSMKYDKEIFEACPDLKYLAIPAVGASFFVDMDDAAEYGVTVMSTPGYNSYAVAEMAIGMAIAVLRMVPLLQSDLRSGIWDESSRGQSMLMGGKKIGIVGNGNVSKALQKLLSSWSVEVSHTDSSSTPDEVDSLVSDSDVVFLCCPLTEKTKGLISADRIKMMKNTAVIVNVARGAVVDEDALYAALKDKKILGAGLDVFIEEPEYGSDLPGSIKRFVDLDNVVVTPHLAGSSMESRVTLGQMIYDDLVSCVSGSPINVYP